MNEPSRARPLCRILPGQSLRRRPSCLPAGRIFHRRRRLRLCRSRLHRADRVPYPGARPACRRGHPLHAGICQIGAMHQYAGRADHRPLSVPAADRAIPPNPNRPFGQRSPGSPPAGAYLLRPIDGAGLEPSTKLTIALSRRRHGQRRRPTFMTCSASNSRDAVSAPRGSVAPGAQIRGIRARMGPNKAKFLAISTHSDLTRAKFGAPEKSDEITSDVEPCDRAHPKRSWGHRDRIWLDRGLDCACRDHRVSAGRNKSVLDLR